MTTIAWPDGTFETIGRILATTGRTVTFTVEATLSGCSICSLDPITDTSTDAFCTTCNGQYWIPTYTTHTISGHVVWGYSDRLLWERGGQLPEGKCRVTFLYSSNLEEKVKESYQWTVDGKTMYLDDYKLKGIRGPSEEHEPSRIAVTLKEEES